MPERREHPVEDTVLERQVLRVAFDPGDLHTFGRGLPAPGVEQLGNEVEPGHVRSGVRRRDRRVACAARDVEHAHSSIHTGPCDDALADVPDVLGQRRVVTGRPHRALPVRELVHLRSSLSCRAM